MSVSRLKDVNIITKILWNKITLMMIIINSITQCIKNLTVWVPSTFYSIHSVTFLNNERNMDSQRVI